MRAKHLTKALVYHRVMSERRRANEVLYKDCNVFVLLGCYYLNARSELCKYRTIMGFCIRNKYMMSRGGLYKSLQMLVAAGYVSTGGSPLYYNTIYTITESGKLVLNEIESALAESRVCVSRSLPSPKEPGPKRGSKYR